MHVGGRRPGGHAHNPGWTQVPPPPHSGEHTAAGRERTGQGEEN